MQDIQGTNSLGQRTGIAFVVVLVGHLFLISATVQSRAGGSVLESATFEVFSRAQRAVAFVVDGLRNGWGNVGGLRHVREENAALRAQLSDMEVRLQEQRALAARSTALQELLDLKTSTNLPTVAAEVIAGNPNPGMLTVTINRGSADGVEADMAVIAPQGVVGRVIGQPAARAARVQLLIDRNAAAGALSERTRAGGMVVGVAGDPPLQLQLISNLADVNAGDRIVTSGVDGVYPKGFVVGTVERSERGQGLYRNIAVRPAVDFSSLESVLIVLVPARGALPEEPAPSPVGEPAR
jgi:rod shape-determining protein MreC